ncbi:hypothetical protein BDV18DRAFT_160716 [Aspergillus unguis]
MGRSKKSLRDVTRLSGRPLEETLIPSPVLASAVTRVSDSAGGANPETEAQGGVEQGWVTSSDLAECGIPYALEDIQDTVLFLLQNPGLTSSVLFRADILFDTEDEKETVDGHEPHLHSQVYANGESENTSVPVSLPTRRLPGFELCRTIVRRLVPRNPQLDRPVDQTCHVYMSDSEIKRRFLIVYTPHVSSREELPYYHPQLRALALLYDDPAPGLGSSPREPAMAGQGEEGTRPGSGTLSVHFLPYPSSPASQSSITSRLERTLTNLLEVQIRITKGRLNAAAPTTASSYASIKDNVVPRNRVQDTYSRLKIKYAADLCERWVESTEPSKHVYEDLGIAAFLIEVWTDLYGIGTRDEQAQEAQQQQQIGERQQKFPGFVDIACGNGVLVYILLSEGFAGWGFDARRRKTWNIFPEHIQERLREEIYIPGPFAKVLSETQGEDDEGLPRKSSESGPGSGLESSLNKGTFIISNHADELTLWTPLLATLLSPSNPPPFLAIPCCSHSLSGARHRYPPPTQSRLDPASISNENENPNTDDESAFAASGDLRKLRATKLAAQNPQSAAFSTSTYGALTEKLVSVSGEVGIPTLKTLLRIPSTRNIGVLGGVSFSEKLGLGLRESRAEKVEEEEVLARLHSVIERECYRDGGIYLAARNWVERASGLASGGGSGGVHAHV